MTDNPRLPIRKWAQLAFGVTIILYGIIGFPALDGLEPEPAAAQLPCAYGGTPGNCRPRPSCTHGGAWPSCAPPPVCTAQAWEGCGPGGKPRPPTCTYGGSYPNCYPNPASGRTCTYGGTYPNCTQAPNTVEVRPPTTCNNGIHGESCQILLDLGVDPEVLDGSGSDSATVAQARLIAEETCRRNPICDRQAMSDAWDALLSDPLFDPERVNRGEQATLMCESLPSGNVPCDPQTDEETIELVQWMCGQGYTTGYTGNCGGIDTIEEANTEFGQGEPMTQAQAWSFNARPLEAVGYVPPFGYTGTVGQTLVSSCINGLRVIQAQVTAIDDGCRPPSCEFGRRDDGWCLPPADTDPPVIYIDGEDVDEDAGTASFRVVLSHASTQTVSVTVVTSDGTARSGSDYSAVNRRVTFSRARTVAVVPVAITDDNRDESDETFMLQMSAPSSNAELGTNPQAEATIRDNDETIPSAVRNLTMNCSTVGVDGEVTVTWMLPDEGDPFGYYSRITGPDSYSSVIRTLPAGAIEHTFDGAPGWGEYTVVVYAFLLEGDGDPTTVTQTCQPTPPMVALSDTTLTVEEGSSVPITATLDIAPASTASVRFNASGATNGTGSCSTGADFYVRDTEFTFTSMTSASVTLYTCDDDDTDDETVTVSLTTTGINGLRLGSPTSVVVTINDDDDDGYGL